MSETILNSLKDFSFSQIRLKTKMIIISVAEI